MTPRYHDVREFIKEVGDKDYCEIIESAQQEATAAAKRRLFQYAEDLKGLLFFLQHVVKPSGVYDHTFLSFRPIVQSLVRKGQLKEEVLKIFDEVE